MNNNNENNDMTPNETESMEPIQQNNVETSVQTDTQSNWNFYQHIQNVKPYQSYGGTNKTPSQVKTKYKRKHKTLQQKSSRRINRK